AAGSHPAQPDTRYQGLGERMAIQNHPGMVIGLGWHSSVGVEGVAPDIILEDGNIVMGGQPNQPLFVSLCHGEPKWVLRVGRYQAGTLATMLECQLKCCQANAMARTGRNFQYLAPQHLQREQGAVIGRRLNRYGVTWPGDSAQGEIDGLHAAVGDDDIILGNRIRVVETTPGKLERKTLMTLRVGVVPDVKRLLSGYI